ncbi:glycosyltransferase family 2 protein [Motilibacter aurantiacus]|uniref:glycosyltransferase family 2 protein n=1 Tax=Motilibacter aurantiacus TaxID=2714955 RepID=UPI00140DCB3B|nr:glycosyltransferase family A protein [Motilibacter aurantiacus]NHC45135.1 glycosyltransferase family 2 protein [Motilibacter aurantiacus]
MSDGHDARTVTLPATPRDGTAGPEPLVSVVIPTRNRASILPRALGAALGQVLDVPQSLEVVVVDDGSTDDTARVLAAVEDPRLRVLRRPRGSGVSRARNAGTQLARGRWVAWMDDDDVWSPTKLKLQLDAVQRTPGARWCNGGAVIVDGSFRILYTQFCPSAAPDLGRTLLRRNHVTGGGSGVLADRRLVLDLGGFDEELSIFADWHMWVRLALAAPIAVVDAPLVTYVDHSEGMSHDRLRLLAELEVLRPKLRALGRAEGAQVEIDEQHLLQWMLRQQVRAGRRRDAALLHTQLVLAGIVPLRHMLPSTVIGMVAPGFRRRRWDRREQTHTDPEYAAEAAPWLLPLQRQASPRRQPATVGVEAP